VTSASDGLVPWDGRAGDIRVGHIIQGSTKAKRDVWKVIDTRNPHQYDVGRTPWLRVQRLGTEQIEAVPPKTVRTPVTFMLTPEEFEHAAMYGSVPALPKTLLADADEIALLVEKLGATEIVSKDHETGEMWCPNYAYGRRHTAEWEPGILILDQLHHLQICHGMDITGLEDITDWEQQMLAVINHHGEAHRDNLPGGFPHRHVPEDTTQL
jgi:hypothetical protein